MNFLGKLRRQPVTDDEWLPAGAVRWEPLAWGVATSLEGDDADMDDQGQAIPLAWRVIFVSQDAPGAELTIWTYAAETSEAHWKGIRYTYTTTDAPGWSYTGWEQDPEDRAYGSLGDAVQGAIDLAFQISREPTPAMGPGPGWAASTLPGIFDWDGRRFDTTIHDPVEES